MLRIHREGFRILGASLPVLILVGVGVAFLPLPLWLLIILELGLLVLMLFLLQFFRNPDRPLPETNGDLIYAPADGTVVVMEEVDETEYSLGRRLQISIFMSPLNVHLNRVPIDGQVAYYKYHPGKYLVAWHPKASTDNEMATIVLRQGDRSLLIRQIAGAMARRIRTYVQEGQQVKQGQELGFIRMGSRVDVLLPPDAEVLVDIGQPVSGNLDVLARWTQGSSQTTDPDSSI